MIHYNEFNSTRIVSKAICIAFAAILFTWLFVISTHQPVIGDMWFPSLRGKQGVPFKVTIEGYINSYLNGNPRIGQLFMVWGGWSKTLLLVMYAGTFASLIWFSGRLAATQSQQFRAHEALGCGAFAVSLFWLIHPSPGQALFYFPITSNYVIPAIFYLIYAHLFLKIFQSAAASWYKIAYLSAFIFAFFCGLGGEHLGPSFLAGSILLVAFEVFYSRIRSESFSNSRLIKLSTLMLGLLLGYIALFFAPGQSKRYGGKVSEAGIKSFDVLLERMDNAVDIAFMQPISIYVSLASLLIAGFVTFRFLTALKISKRHDSGSSVNAREVQERRILSLIASIGTVFSLLVVLLVSPILADRLLIAFHIFLAVAGSLLLSLLAKENEAIKLAALFLITFILVPDLLKQNILQKQYADDFRHHEILAMEALDRGESSIVLPAYAVDYFANSRYLFPEFPRYFASANTNQTAASFFGLSSVRLGPSDGVVGWSRLFEKGVTLRYNRCNDKGRWSGASDPLGVIVCGSDYEVQYDPSGFEWTVSGDREVFPAYNVNTFETTRRGPEPESGFLSHWGALRIFDDYGRVYDKNWNEIGTLIPHPPDGESL